MEELKKHVTAALNAGRRVAWFEFDGTKYWVKQAQERGFFLRLQKGSARSLLQAEIAALRLFSASGIPVPELAVVADDHFVSKDIGPTVETFIRDNPKTRKNLLIAAAKSMAQLHNAGLAHGGLHMRNMCIDAKNHQEIGFIDLEKASQNSASLEAKAYDVVVFNWSMLSIDSAAIDDLKAAKEAYLDAGPFQVWQTANKWALDKNWLRVAVKPLVWHERKFKQNKPYKRYKAVPLTLDFLQT